MAKRKKFPETLIVWWDEDGKLFLCSTEIDDAACKGEAEPVGIYKLDHRAHVVNRTTLISSKKRKPHERA